MPSADIWEPKQRSETGAVPSSPRSPQLKLNDDYTHTHVSVSVAGLRELSPAVSPPAMLDIHNNIIFHITSYSHSLFFGISYDCRLSRDAQIHTFTALWAQATLELGHMYIRINKNGTVSNKFYEKTLMSFTIFRLPT